MGTLWLRTLLHKLLDKGMSTVRTARTVGDVKDARTAGGIRSVGDARTAGTATTASTV